MERKHVKLFQKLFQPIQRCLIELLSVIQRDVLLEAHQTSWFFWKVQCLPSHDSGHDRAHPSPSSVSIKHSLGVTQTGSVLTKRAEDGHALGLLSCSCRVLCSVSRSFCCFCTGQSSASLVGERGCQAPRGGDVILSRLEKSKLRLDQEVLL